ncbi:MAG: hypothetical protein WEB09_06685 [Nitriliruptor sp.]
MSSRTAPIRQLRLVAVLLLLVITGVAGAVPDHAEAAACDGVSVRVERTSSTVAERCASGRPADGLAALESAGFTYTFVPGQPGFVCTIDGYPNPCNGAPADAYWSYWSAAAGDSSWTYNTRGAGNRTPPPGSAEAWVFGSGSPPSTPPPATPDRDPSPEPDSGEDEGGTDRPDPEPSPSRSPSTSTPRPSPTPDAPSGSDDAPGDAVEDETTAPTAPLEDAGSADAGSDDEDETDATEPDEAATSDDGTDDTSSEGADVAADDAEALGDPVTVGDPPGGGSIVGPAVGLTLVAGVAGAAVLRARRRDDGSVL